MPGIGGVTVNLRGLDEDVSTSKATAGDGSYIFTHVGSGVYLVEEINPAGFGSTTPDRVRISMVSDGSAVVNFGDRKGYRIFLPIIFKGHNPF